MLAGAGASPPPPSADKRNSPVVLAVHIYLNSTIHKLYNDDAILCKTLFKQFDTQIVCTMMLYYVRHTNITNLEVAIVLGIQY